MLLRAVDNGLLGPAGGEQPGIDRLQHGSVDGEWSTEPEGSLGMVERLRTREWVNEDVERFGTREHEPQNVLGEHLAREEDLEASSRVRPGWGGNERVHLYVGRRRKPLTDDGHE